MLKMTAQNGFCVRVLIFTGRVLLLAGLSIHTPASAQENAIGIGCKTWDASISECQECHNGFIGKNCAIECRYPSFGENCQNRCNCDKDFCNISTGCKDGSPTKLLKSTSSSIKETSENQMKTETLIAACSVGFVGKNCDIPCRFPAFGLDCQSECNCSKEYCNHVIGCNESSTFCYFEEGHRLQVMMYSTVVLSVWAILQISIYLYFSLKSSPENQFNISTT